MNKVILVIGLAVVLLGVWVVVKPAGAVKTVRLLIKGPLIYIPGAVRVVVGIVFLIAARECSIPWAIITFGVLMLTAGVIMLVVKPEKTRGLIEWFCTRPSAVQRVCGAVAVLAGAAIAYAS
jgi:hypothetical protein